MTDHLTEAVRRLRQLQEDVERLKQGRNGEIRELRSIGDTAVCDDDVDAGADASVSDATGTADSVATGGDASVTDTTDSTDTVATGADASVDETAACDDTASVTETIATNIGEYDTSSYDDGSTYG